LSAEEKEAEFWELQQRIFEEKEVRRVRRTNGEELEDSDDDAPMVDYAAVNTFGMSWKKNKEEKERLKEQKRVEEEGKSPFIPPPGKTFLGFIDISGASGPPVLVDQICEADARLLVRLIGCCADDPNGPCPRATDGIRELACGVMHALAMRNSLFVDEALDDGLGLELLEAASEADASLSLRDAAARLFHFLLTHHQDKREKLGEDSPAYIAMLMSLLVSGLRPLECRASRLCAAMCNSKEVRAQWDSSQSEYALAVTSRMTGTHSMLWLWPIGWQALRICFRLSEYT
jgi:hypothetical protein